MIEDFINALQNFRRNKIRTFLSLLGIIIGVASVIVIMSMGVSSTRQVEDSFGSSGLDMVSVSSGFWRRRRASVTLQFNDSFRESLFANVTNIKKIWYKNSVSATLSYGDTSASASCTAVETGYMEAFGLALDSGRYFNITDNVMGTQKIIIGSNIANTLFPDGNACGNQIIIVADKVSFSFEVIGVLKEQNSGMEDSATGCYIPRGFYAKKIAPNPLAATIMVQAVSKEKTTVLTEDINAYCEKLSGTEGSVNVNSMQTMLEQISEITNTMSVLLAAIAAISLLVGGIGIMNIMIVTVTERKQEIGIRKALGASPNVIRQQFLIESASITVLGGILGIFFGVCISFAVEYLRSLAYVISWQSCIVSFFFSVFVGIFFGFSPASRAAKLDPVAALSA